MNRDINITQASLIETMRNFCITVENALQKEQQEFTAEMLELLPRLYLGFITLDTTQLTLLGDEYLPQYLHQDYYDSIRNALSSLYGAEDTYLETFENDMKYSDTPIAATISEGIADIFQDIYNCVCAIKESEGLLTTTALTICLENFKNYWSQILCNVLRPLNHLQYNPDLQ